MAERVLLTGATGFIGRVVARELSAAGFQLSALVRGPSPEARAAEAGLLARLCPGDLRDAGAVAAAVEGSETVVHLAALVDPALVNDEREVWRSNHDATLELASRARAAGARRFVFMSSIAAMGFWSGPARADSECRPVTAYGRAKLEAERGLVELVRSGFDVVVLRPPTVYGPGERYNFLAWVRAVERGVFRVIGGGDNAFPLCTTENLARAVTAAASTRLRAGTYLVADAEAYTVERVHRAIAAALGRRPARFKLPRRAALVIAVCNELVAARLSGVPSLLTRSRVATLTAHQPFDVAPLLAQGVALDASLEASVAKTVADYRARGLLPAREAGSRAFHARKAVER
jgi:nucleoside-diphosphate-sugar epimerase